MRTLLGLVGCTVLAVVVWGFCLFCLWENAAVPQEILLDDFESEAQLGDWPW
jgi:hypothetical protein